MRFRFKRHWCDTCKQDGYCTHPRSVVPDGEIPTRDKRPSNDTLNTIGALANAAKALRSELSHVEIRLELEQLRAKRDQLINQQKKGA